MQQGYGEQALLAAEAQARALGYDTIALHVFGHDHAARELGSPVFAKDWLEATLIRCALQPAEGGPPLGSAGHQLLTTLAERQLQLGQSIILDSAAGTLSIRAEWRGLAQTYQAEWRVIECICSAEAAQRDRWRERRRGLPGWPELDWSDVERVRASYAPWAEARLILDAVHPLEENISAALRDLRGGSIDSNQPNAL